MKPDISSINYRPCIIDEQEALFHMWSKKDKIFLEFNTMVHSSAMDKIKRIFNDDNIIPKCTTTRKVSNILGIVEFRDGTVKEVDPEKIRFLDSTCIFGQYCFDYSRSEGKEDK